MPLWEATLKKGQQHTITFPRPLTLTGVLLCLENPGKVYFDATIEVHVSENDGEKDSIIGVLGGSSAPGSSSPPVQSMSINKAFPHGVPITFYTKTVPVVVKGPKGSTYGTKSLKDNVFQVQVSGFSD